MIASLAFVAALVLGTNADLLPLPVPNLHECTVISDRFNSTVRPFCKSVCEQCVCKDTTAQNTCTDTCTGAWFQTPLLCGIGISFNGLGTFPIEWTKDSACAANAVANPTDWSPQDTCKFVCDCCKPGNAACYTDCNNAFFPWFYDQVCHTVSVSDVQLPSLLN